MFVAPDLGQYALLMLFVPAAVAVVFGLMLFRHARERGPGRRARVLGGAGLGLGLFGLLVIVTAFSQMVRRDPSLLLPYSMRPGSPAWRATQIYPPSTPVVVPKTWEARAQIQVLGVLWAPHDPAAETVPLDVPFDPEVRLHGRLANHAALLLRAGEIAGDPARQGTAWMSLDAARQLLAAARDPILRSDRVRENYQREVVGAARVEGDDPRSGRFSVYARAATPERAVAVATAVAGAVVDTDTESVAFAHRGLRQRALHQVEKLERELRTEHSRLAAWRAEAGFHQELPRVESRIAELERDLVTARGALRQAEETPAPTEPRARITRYPTEARPR